jgi:hypothetical protein
LVRALEDQDQAVSKNAQLVIRYLGNPAGMEALVRHYSKAESINIVGPVPLPLTDWDYDFIKSTYLGRPKNFGYLSTHYLYALALDGSPKAKELLPPMLDAAKAAGTDEFTLGAVRSGELASPLSSDDKDLAGGVLKKARFLRPVDREHATAKLIALNKAHDKALLEIDVDHGVLAEAKYHVVVSRSNEGWKLYSISLVAES